MSCWLRYNVFFFSRFLGGKTRVYKYKDRVCVYVCTCVCVCLALGKVRVCNVLIEFTDTDLYSHFPRRTFSSWRKLRTLDPSAISHQFGSYAPATPTRLPGKFSSNYVRNKIFHDEIIHRLEKCLTAQYSHLRRHVSENANFRLFPDRNFRLERYRRVRREISYRIDHFSRGKSSRSTPQCHHYKCNQKSR